MPSMQEKALPSNPKKFLKLEFNLLVYRGRFFLSYPFNSFFNAQEQITFHAKLTSIESLLLNNDTSE